MFNPNHAALLDMSLCLSHRSLKFNMLNWNKSKTSSMTPPFQRWRSYLHSCSSWKSGCGPCPFSLSLILCLNSYLISHQVRSFQPQSLLNRVSCLMTHVSLMNIFSLVRQLKTQSHCVSSPVAGAFVMSFSSRRYISLRLGYGFEMKRNCLFYFLILSVDFQSALHLEGTE